MIEYEIYTIGWICAIRAELVAAQELLDSELMEPVPTPENDNNTYTLGKIGPHHIVIAGLPRGQYGLISAANAARDMVRTFPNVRIGFMVGIGGGVPTQYDVRLGDIVVGSPSYRSGGLIQYDHGKTIQGKGIDFMGTFNQPPVSVLATITKLSAQHVRKGHNLNQIVEDMLSKNPNLVEEGFQRPNDDTDKLYESRFIHPRVGAKCSDVCHASNLKQRDPRTNGQGKPNIHYGLIASGSQLMEDAIARDKLAEKEYVLCFEMEAAGLANHFPCVVIRGICDYSDSHRGRTWQGYAALVAAAYAKQLLLQIPPQKIKEEKRMKDILQQIDERLQPIAETKEIVEVLNIKGKREDELKILDWLNAVDYSSEHHGFLQPQQRQPGTGQQFLKSENFESWLRTKNAFLFCCGMPGAGKTITTAITIEYLHSNFGNDPTVGVAYVYCNYQKRDQQKPQDLFASLLKQLAQSQSALPKSVYDLYEKNHHGRKRPSFEDIETTLCNVVNTLSTTFVVIDALDEHDTWNTFLSDILALRTKTSANVFLTSRPKPSIPGRIEGCLIHDIQADDQDVEMYIDQRMTQMMLLSEQNQELSEKAKEDCRRLIKGKLSKAVNGVFLLARIYLDNLKEETNMKGILVFLENLHSGLRAYKDAYEKTIRRIRNQGPKHRELARRALTWLTFAQGILTKEAFRHALSVEDGMSELKDEDLHSTNLILHVCMDLVKIDEGSQQVSLLHFTTMEYLKRSPNCLLSLESPDDPAFIDNPSDTEAERSLAREYYEMKLAITCVTYLLFEDFRNGRCKYEGSDRLLDDAISRRLTDHPLYSYATSRWGYHARRGQKSNKILDFLNSQPHVSASCQFLPLSGSIWEYRRLKSLDSIGHVNGLHLTAFFGLTWETASLLGSGMESDVRDDWGRTPLSYASTKGHVDVVAQFLDAGVDPETKSILENSSWPRTALSQAAKNGHAEVIKLLLEKGKATPDSNPSLFLKGLFERTPLSFASEAGHEDVVDILLGAEGVNPDYKDETSRSSLHYAVLAGHTPIVSLFVAKEGVDLDTRDKEGKSPLHYAALAGHQDISRLLIATKRVDPDSSDGEGMTPLSHATIAGHEAVVKLLLATNQVYLDPENSRNTILFPSILQQRHEPERIQSLDDIIKAMLANGRVNVNSKNIEGFTPLFHAVCKGHKSIVQLLLSETDADPNTQDVDGRTVLSHAASSDYEILKLLLSYKVIDPNLEDKGGRTPLSYAAGSQLQDNLQLLFLDDRVKANTKDYSGRTPLSYAAENGNVVAVKFLLECSELNLNGTDASGRTPILYAVGTRYLGVLKLFLSDARVEVDPRDDFGRTPLSYLAERAQILINNLVLGNKRNGGQQYSINGGLVADEFELGEVRKLMRQLIVDRGADIFSQDKEGRTPVDILSELLYHERGTTPHQQGEKRKYSSIV